MSEDVKAEQAGIGVEALAWEAAAEVEEAECMGAAASAGVRDAAYVTARAGLGVAKMGEGAYRAVKTFESKVLGDDDAAVKAARSDAVERVAEELDDKLQVGDKVKAVGNRAEAVGGFVGGIGVAVAAEVLVPEGIAAVAATAAVEALSALDVSGELLENAAADGKITGKEAVEAVGVGAGMAALSVVVGEAAGAIMEDIESRVAATGVEVAVEDVAGAAEETVAKEAAESTVEGAGKAVAETAADEGSEAAFKKVAEKAGQETAGAAAERAAEKAGKEMLGD